MRRGKLTAVYMQWVAKDCLQTVKQ